MARRHDRETLHILVGALVVVIGIAFVWWSYGYRSEKGPDISGYELSARFRSVDGIGIGSKVTLAGITIGKVVASDFDPAHYSADLTFRIEKDIEIPEDSIAMIISDGVFGSKFVQIVPGGAMDMLQPGGEFEYVQDSILFEELLQKVINAAEARRKAAKEGGEQDNGQQENTGG